MSASGFLDLFVAISIQAAIVVVLTHWVGGFTGNERTQCRLWTACYVLLLASLAAALLFPHLRLVQPWANIDPRTVAHVATLEIRVGSVLFKAWVTGAIASIAIFAIRSYRTMQFLKSCQPLDQKLLSDDGLRTELRNASQPSGSTIQVLTSDKLSAPFCWQFHRPYIVLPQFLVDRIGPDLQFIVRHEVEHLRTGHPMQLFLQRVVEIVFWYHPMIWWASHRSALVREFACDEAAVHSKSDIVVYLRSLLRVVEHATQGHAPSSLTFGGGKSIVAARARRLVLLADRDKKTSRLRFSGGAAFLLMATLTVLASVVRLPLDALASPRSYWSPWPTWSSDVLHDYGIRARDYEEYDPRTQLYELQHDVTELSGNR